jgi:hypothetical protein
MMADKKVDRYRPERALDPTQQLSSALSNTGTVNMADTTHDKGKSSLIDKFRRREERWRREQSLHDREATEVIGLTHREGASTSTEPADDQGSGKGGAK